MGFHLNSRYFFFFSIPPKGLPLRTHKEIRKERGKMSNSKTQSQKEVA